METAPELNESNGCDCDVFVVSTSSSCAVPVVLIVPFCVFSTNGGAKFVTVGDDDVAAAVSAPTTTENDVGSCDAALGDGIAIDGPIVLGTGYVGQ